MINKLQRDNILKPIKQHIEKANNEMGRAEKQQEITNLQSTLYNVCQSI